MPESWIEARDAYNYPVNLADFADAREYKGWFESNIDGDLHSTRAFQDRFRENAPYHLDAWYEVVHWKLYTTRNKQGELIRDKATQDRIQYIKSQKIVSCEGTSIKFKRLNAEHLWKLCCDFTQSESLDIKDFQTFQRKIVRGKGVAIAATFPAFLDPMRFPMVDRHVAKWVRKNGKQHGFPSMSIVPVGTIVTDDWDFVKLWIQWCRLTASKLSELTGKEWSARDVEMAVFTADRKRLYLNPLR